jgi:hypothetical protein
MTTPWGMIHARREAAGYARTLTSLRRRIEKATELLEESLDSSDLGLVCELVIVILIGTTEEEKEEDYWGAIFT